MPTRPRLAAVFALLLTTSAPAATIDVWIGTATNAGLSRGVYHATLDPATGELSTPTLAAVAREPGFLSLHPRLPVLYGTRDTHDGAAVAWRIERVAEGSPRLVPFGEQPTGDGGPCHVSVDPSGGVLLTAQYGGGSVASFPLGADGAIGPRASLVEHADLTAALGAPVSGAVPDRQEAPHAHWAGATPDGALALVPDLGLDRVVVYDLDQATAQLTPRAAAPIPPGGGPRHLAFHPDGRRAYVVNELAMALTELSYDAASRALTAGRTTPTMTDDQKRGERMNSASEVRVHPSGRFVYVANRGHDTITTFAVDAATGALRQVDQEPVRGSHPRNFGVDPSGRWLIAAGRDSGTLAVFEIDQTTGALTYTLRTALCPSPICVIFGAAG